MKEIINVFAANIMYYLTDAFTIVFVVLIFCFLTAPIKMDL